MSTKKKPILKKGRKLSESEELEIYKYSQGASIKKTAEKFNIGSKRVTQLRSKYSNEVPKYNKKFPTRKEFVNLLETTITLVQRGYFIAEATLMSKISYRTIRDRILYDYANDEEVQELWRMLLQSEEVNLLNAENNEGNGRGTKSIMLLRSRHGYMDAYQEQMIKLKQKEVDTNKPQTIIVKERSK